MGKKKPTAFSVSLPPEPEGFDDATLTIRGVRVSSPRVDRDNEICEPTGCRLEDFKENPVGLWAHEQSEFPVSRWADPDGNCSLAIRADGITGNLTFSQANPNGPILYGLYREKTLRAFSVGFVPVEGEYLTDREMKAMGAPPRPGRVYRHTVWDLLEISCVPVGANPDALAKAIHKGTVGGCRIPAALKRELTAFAPKRKRASLLVGQATRLAKILSTTPEAVAVSEEKKPETPDAKPADAPVKKELGTTSDTEGGAVVPDAESQSPHAMKMAACKMAAHMHVDKMFDADPDDADAHKAALDGIADEHDQYREHERAENGDTDDTDVDDKDAADGDGDEPKDDDSDLKAFADIVRKAVADAVTPLQAELDAVKKKLADLPSSDELAEAIAG